jgi:hypothetical protein
MAPRPSWHGYLKLSLVTCPVSMLQYRSVGPTAGIPGTPRGNASSCLPRFPAKVSLLSPQPALSLGGEN